MNNKLVKIYEFMRIGIDVMLRKRGMDLFYSLFCQCQFPSRKEELHEQYNN